MAKMSKHYRLQRRGTIFWFRCRVPTDLVEHYGKQEIVESLRTRDEREARLLGAARSEQQEQEFDRIRAGRTVTELTDEQIQAIAEAHYHSVLLVDEMRREHGLSESQYDALDAGVDEGDDILPDALARGDIEPVEHLIGGALHRHGIALPKDSPSYRRLGYALLQSAVRANDAIRERQQGSIVKTPSPSAVHLTTPQRRNGVNLAEVLDKWAAERKPRSKTRTGWSAIIHKFTKMHGKLPIVDIVKAQVVAYKDALVKEALAPATINAHIGAIRTLLAYAMQNDLCERNPAAGIRVQAAKTKTREHIPIEDLQRLFGGDVFTKGARPAWGAGEAAFWLPLLALFSGARREEIGQMRVQDVKRSPDGIDYVELTEKGEGQQLKNVGSSRSVPLHPELIRLGFLRYIEERRAAGDGRVFPRLRQDVYGRWTENWGKWWRSYRDSVGVGARWKDMHALRHTFKRACRECGIPEDIHDALTGHDSASVARTYGGSYPLVALAEAIKKLRYAGLDLSGLTVTSQDSTSTRTTRKLAV